jgi:hypothetical protein
LLKVQQLLTTYRRADCIIGMLVTAPSALAPAALPRVFISYSRLDAAIVDRLDAALTACGFELLIDRRNIHHFKDWWAEIALLVSSSDIVSIILSPEAVSSDYCLKEIEFEASLGKRLKHRPPGLQLRSLALEEAERWLATRPRHSEEPVRSTRDFITESRRHTTRSQRRTVVVALATATLAIALSGFSVWQMRAAENNFAAARTAADGLVPPFLRR